MSDPTSEKAISDLVLLSRCRAAEALGLNLSPSEVMALAALAAERDRLEAILDESRLAFENVDAQVSDEGEFTERSWGQLHAALKGDSRE